MTTFAYSRVSTGNQGMSLVAQRTTLEAYATTLQLEVDELVVDENVSGSTKLSERPNGGGMFRTLKEGDNLIVTKFDRLFRNSEDAIVSINLFKNKGIRVFIMDMGGEVTGDGVGKLIYTVLAAVADFERTRIIERIRDVKSLQMKQGRYLGGEVPWGHSVVEKEDGKFIAPEEWLHEALLFLADCRWNRRLSSRQVATKISQKFAPITHKTVIILDKRLFNLLND